MVVHTPACTNLRSACFSSVLFIYPGSPIWEDAYSGFLLKEKEVLVSVPNQNLFPKEQIWMLFRRVCLLVQDALGLFSEVRSEGGILKDRQLEGKCCRLSGMKVLQKVTRAR